MKDIKFDQTENYDYMWLLMTHYLKSMHAFDNIQINDKIQMLTKIQNVLNIFYDKTIREMETGIIKFTKKFSSANDLP